PDRGVDADDLTREVQERTARVPLIDGGIGLEEVVIARRVETDVVLRSPLRRKDAGGNRMREPEGVADGDDPIAYLDAVRVPELQGDEVGLFVHAQYGDVGATVAPYDGGQHHPAVGELD